MTEQPHPAPDPVRDRSEAALEAFISRARRVAEHSLARDRDGLASLTKTTWHLSVDLSTQTSTITTRLPPEESVESLAARVRPLILQDEPVHYGKALNALGYLLKDLDDSGGSGDVDRAKRYIDWLRSQWKAIDSKSEEMRAYRLEKGRVDGTAEPVVTTDNALAFAWFYGDVVHADAQRRALAADFDITDRYEAAVRVVARTAWLAYATLDFIEQLRAAGHLDLDAAVFEEPVTVAETEVTREATVYIAPVGTKPPTSINDPFPLGEG